MPPVATIHIAALYDEAARLARLLHGWTDHENPDIKFPPDTPWKQDYMNIHKAFDRVLERIDNLTAHARQELEDERLRLRDQWPVV